MKRFKIKLKMQVLAIVLIFALSLGGCTDVIDVTVGNERDLLIEAHSAKIEDNIGEWFSGEKLHKYVGNNRDYEWYVDQALTGEHRNNNCGPASVEMAMRWVREDFTGTAEEAREHFMPEGGWWYTDQVMDYFKLHEQEISYLFFDTSDKDKGINDLKESIESGNIVLLCLDMGYVSREFEWESRINRFYSYDDGHFLIVKGYAEVDDKTYFEVYDPNNWNQTYEDGTQRGKDRYYEAEMLIDAVYEWWTIGYVIGEKGEDVIDNEE